MVDFDECEFHLYSCDINADCKNTIGSYECECRSGYRGNGIICNGIIVFRNVIISESNFLLWNIPGSNDAVTVTLG